MSHDSGSPVVPPDHIHLSLSGHEYYAGDTIPVLGGLGIYLAEFGTVPANGRGIVRGIGRCANVEEVGGELRVGN